MYSLRTLLAAVLVAFVGLGSFSSTTASQVDQLHLTRGTDAAGNPEITLGIDRAEGFTSVRALSPLLFELGL
jgi:hypothetical protein